MVSDARYCVYCGRALVVVEEPSNLYDRETGARVIERWKQCPKFPRHGFFAIFAGPHESFLETNPILGREYR